MHSPDMAKCMAALFAGSLHLVYLSTSHQESYNGSFAITAPVNGAGAGKKWDAIKIELWRVTAWPSKRIPLGSKTAQAPENPQQRISLWSSVRDWTSGGEFLQWIQQQSPRIKPLLPETYEIPDFWWSGHPVPTIPQLSICNAPPFQLHVPTFQ